MMFNHAMPTYLDHILLEKYDVLFFNESLLKKTMTCLMYLVGAHMHIRSIL